MTELPQPLRILIVEDSQDDYELLLLRLRQSGFDPSSIRVETVADIQSAMAAGGWQMIISDYDLPGFDGLRALELVRAADPLVPFFIVSGVIDEEQAVAAMKAGAQDFFFKGKLARLAHSINRELELTAKRRERAEQEAALARDRSLIRHDRIRFVDVMSHELRTPLHIVNLAAAMLAHYGERMGEAARRERISEIQDAVVRMTRVIDKVLLTSQIELRRWELRSETFDLAPWCADFVKQNTVQGDQRRRVNLRLGDLPPQVTMDPRVLEIALQNLLSNALKYSPADAPVDLEVSRRPGGLIEFNIRDSGIGIPPSEIGQVMGSFFRASNVGDVQGTGLGLAIVKGCADLHGGTLEVTSEPGQGTCVRMCVPDWLQAEPSREENSAPQTEPLTV